MSDSPIIQDGKLVGAVPHVLVSDLTKLQPQVANMQKQVGGIYMISHGITTYILQYSAKTQRRWASIKIVEE